MIKITCNIPKYGDIHWKCYYSVGSIRHNNNGPAAEWYDGEKWWYVNGNTHRLDGPAVERPNGNKFWYIHGKEYNTELEYWIAVHNYNTHA